MFKRPKSEAKLPKKRNFKKSSSAANDRFGPKTQFRNSLTALHLPSGIGAGGLRQQAVQRLQDLGNRSVRRMIQQSRRSATREIRVQRNFGRDSEPSRDNDEQLQQIASSLENLPEQITADPEELRSMIRSAVSSVGVSAVSGLSENVGDLADTAVQGRSSSGLDQDIGKAVDAIVRGDYIEAAKAIQSMLGSAGAAFQFAHHISNLVVGGSSIPGLAFTAEILGTASNALAVWVALGVSFNNSLNSAVAKYYNADVSGILAAKIFNNSSIHPHRRLVNDVRGEIELEERIPRYRASMFAESQLESLELALQDARRIWNQQFQGNPEKIRAIQDSYSGDWQRFWRDLVRVLERHGSSDGRAPSLVEQLIGREEEEIRRRQRERRALRRRFFVD